MSTWPSSTGDEYGAEWPPPPDVAGRGRITRDGILDCATQVFAERGYRATNLMHVASRLGVTRQALYYHYPRKHDILLALFHRMMDALRSGADEIVAQNPPPGELFALLLENHGRVVARNIDLVTILMCENAEFGEALPKVQHERRVYTERLIAAYQDGVRAEALRDFDPKLAVYALLDALNCMFRWYRTGGPIGPDEIASFTTQLLRGGFAIPAPAR